MKETKNLYLRLPPEVWSILREESYHTQVSLNTIIVGCLQKHIKNIENKLTTT